MNRPLPSELNFRVNTAIPHIFLLLDFDEEMGSEEESGKDWSELEEEAAKGKLQTLRFVMVTGVNGVQFGL